MSDEDEKHQMSTEELPEGEEEDEQEVDESLICRFYKREYPDTDDLVICKILKIHDNGAYVSLLEYNDIEGMIPFTEVTKRRVNSVNRLVRVGKVETMMVLRVDPEKGYIDLSKKKVHLEEAEKRNQFYKKAKVVHSIMKQTASLLGVPLIDIYQKFGWPLYDKYEHAYDAFKVCMNDADSVLEGINIDQEERKHLISCISKRMMPSAIKIRAEFELTCFTYQGVDTIKKALLQAKADVNTDDFDIKYKLIAPPIYNAEVLTLDKQKSIQKLEDALKVIELVIKENDGTFKQVYGPRVIGANDERDMEDIIGLVKEISASGSDVEDNDEGMGDIEGIDDEDE